MDKPVYYLSHLGNSSGYEKTLRKKNLQLTELQFYIKNITRCLGILGLLYARRQDHHLNISQVFYSLKIILSMNHQAFDIFQ